MRSKYQFVACLLLAFLAASACSSTSVVASNDRAVEPDSATDDAANSATPNVNATATPQEEAASDATDDGAGDDATEAEAGDSSDELPVEADPAVPINEGFGLGGADQIASLLADCEADNDLACDILFVLTPFDSAEEAAAVTCAGRSDVEVAYCTDGVETGDDGFLAFDPGSSGVPRIVEACVDDANMTACDFLYYRSPVGSDLESIGSTCGGRINVADPDCRTAMAGRLQPF